MEKVFRAFVSKGGAKHGKSMLLPFNNLLFG